MGEGAAPCVREEVGVGDWVRVLLVVGLLLLVTVLLLVMLADGVLLAVSLELAPADTLGLGV